MRCSDLISKLSRQSKLIVSTTIRANFTLRFNWRGYTSCETEIKLTPNDSESWILAWAIRAGDRPRRAINPGPCSWLYRSEKQTPCPIARWYQRQSAKNGRTNKSRVETHTAQSPLDESAPRSSRLFSIDNQSFPILRGTPQCYTVLSWWISRETFYLHHVTCFVIEFISIHNIADWLNVWCYHIINPLLHK